MIVERVISGGQTGADAAALRAARRLGIPTGGHAPRGWRTQAGPAPWLADYGLVESPWDYAGRTRANVRDGCATVRLAANFSSPGEVCTLRAIEMFRKPHHDVLFVRHATGAWSEADPRAVERFREFLWDNRVRVLNVAGNAERTAPGIGMAVEAFLVSALGC